MAPPPNSEELITEFCNLTQCSTSEAQNTLQQADWDYKTAVQLWYASLDEAPEELEDMEEDEPTDPQPIPSTSGAAESGPSAGASSSRQTRQGGGIRTLQDLTSTGSHDHDDDDDHSDNDYFTGGEKSGLAVHGGNRDPQDHIQDLLDRARRSLPRPGGDDDESSPQSRFTGRGMTLGGDDAPSRVIEDPNASRPQPRPRVQRTLHLWEDGFSVDDGPLYRYDDPENEETLNMIHSGRAPLHLLNVQPGQEVDLSLDVQKDKSYIKPMAQYKPFSGQGHRLGSPTPGPSTASASTPIPAATRPSAPAVASPPSEMNVDDSEPTITLQIRLGDGTRLQSRFNVTHTIGDVYGFVDRASPASAARPYALMTTFPSKELDDREAVLGDLSDFKRGGVVVQKWK